MDKYICLDAVQHQSPISAVTFDNSGRIIFVATLGGNIHSYYLEGTESDSLGGVSIINHQILLTAATHPSAGGVLSSRQGSSAWGGPGDGAGMGGGESRGRAETGESYLSSTGSMDSSNGGSAGVHSGNGNGSISSNSNSPSWATKGRARTDTGSHVASIRTFLNIAAGDGGDANARLTPFVTSLAYSALPDHDIDGWDGSGVRSLVVVDSTQAMRIIPLLIEFNRAAAMTISADFPPNAEDAMTGSASRRFDQAPALRGCTRAGDMVTGDTALDASGGVPDPVRNLVIAACPLTDCVVTGAQGRSVTIYDPHVGRDGGDANAAGTAWQEDVEVMMHMLSEEEKRQGQGAAQSANGGVAEHAVSPVTRRIRYVVYTRVLVDASVA